MTKPNEKLVEFPGQTSRDVFTDVLRAGARQLLATVIEAEVDDYLAARGAAVDATGHRGVVRNGHLPERKSCRGRRAATAQGAAVGKWIR